MKTTIKEFIAPYIEAIKTPCLIGSIEAISPKYEIGLIETKDIEFDEKGCVDFGLGRDISRLTETTAWVWFCGGYVDKDLTEQHSIYIELNNEEAVVLDLKTMSVNKYKQQQ